MLNLLTVLHVIITIGLIFLVLVQDSKGGGMGAFGGGGNSSSVLGATGATSLASKLTQWFAVAFAISCITLAMYSGKSKKSVVDQMAPVPPPATMAAGVAGATATPTLTSTPTLTATPTATPAAATVPAEAEAAKTSEQNSAPKK
jgi:preprotein translocase subunit SecG